MSLKPPSIKHPPSPYTSQPYYVWLMALYPILFLYSRNLGDVFASEVGDMLETSLVGVTVLFGVVWVLFRNVPKAGAITAIFTLAFFSYGHVYNLLLRDAPEWESALKLAYLLIAIAGIVMVARIKPPTRIQRIAPALNVIAALLLIMTLPPMITFWVRGAQQAAEEQDAQRRARQIPDSFQRPDIYYIILDGYSSNAFLLHDFDYDNSAFTNALVERGFYVAYESHTPYAITVPAKFATLNMRYITNEDEKAARRTQSDIEYLRQGIADNTTARELQALGYTYIFMLSGYDVPSTVADVNIDFHPGGTVYFDAGSTSATGTYDPAEYYQVSFKPLLLETTLLRELAQQLEEDARPVDDQPYDFRAPERALAVWDEAELIPARQEATFTVIHIIKPHEPVAFDHEGNIVKPFATTQNSTRAELSARFFAQLEFVNARTLRLIDRIIANSDVPPIIILQGDHGSVFGNPRSADRDRTNFGILNAYRFPRHRCEGLTRDIIPVNSFRVMLNCYFDAGYQMLEPHYYDVVVGYEDLFRHEEIDIDAWAAEHEGR